VTLREYVSDGVTLPDREELEHLELVGLVDVEGVREVVTERVLVTDGDGVPEFVPDGLLEALPDLEEEDA